MPKTKVYRAESGQRKTTIPKGIAEALDLEGGESLEWKIKSKNRLEIIIEAIE